MENLMQYKIFFLIEAVQEIISLCYMKDCKKHE